MKLKDAYLYWRRRDMEEVGPLTDTADPIAISAWAAGYTTAIRTLC
jgi:hypothetical protein